MLVNKRDLNLERQNIMFSINRANVLNCSELFWVLAGRGKEEGNKRNRSDLFRTILGAGGAGAGERKRKDKFVSFSELFWAPAGRGQ